MSNYHYQAVLHALRNVQTSGKTAEIGGVYADHLPIDITLEGLVRKAGLTLTICKSSGRAIIQRPFREAA